MARKPPPPRIIADPTAAFVDLVNRTAGEVLLKTGLRAQVRIGPPGVLLSYHKIAEFQGLEIWAPTIVEGGKR